MDKQNYTLRGIKAQDIKTYYAELEKSLTEEVESSILKRKRVLKSLKPLIYAIYLYFSEQLSFQRLSDVMACQHGITMSDTAWRKQILKAAPILWDAMKKLPLEGDAKDSVLGYMSACAVDATNIPIQGENETSMRVHTQFSLTEYRCTYAEITDCHGGETIKRFPLQKQTLYLADRAYGKTPQLAYAIEQQAVFLIRIAPHQVKFFSDPECRHKFLFPDFIQKKTAFSMPVYFKYKREVYHIRLTGMKIPEEKQEAAERRVRRKASRNQRTASAGGMEAAKWVILASNLPETVSDEMLMEAYRRRWQIELYFKRTKSLLHFRKIRRSSITYRHSMVFLWLTLSFLLVALQLRILRFSNFSLSDFNAFSLAAVILA